MDLLGYKELFVRPVDRLAGTVAAPASKSYSARAVLAATLANGRSRIENIASSQNVRAMVECCETLGADVYRTTVDRIEVTGLGHLRDGTTLCPGNSGIVLRLLMGATATLRRTTFMTPYVHSLGRRSNTELVTALQELGVRCTTENADATLPITLDGSGVHGGDVSVSGRRSSQFLSGLLYLGGVLDEPLTVRVTADYKARPMVRTTLQVLRAAGVPVTADPGLMTFHLPGANPFRPAAHVVQSDPASVAALLAVASAVESDVTIRHNGLHELGGVLDHLRAAGVSISEDASTLRVRGGDVRPVDFDGAMAPDAVLPLAALAAQADGTSRFYNIEHLRYKECDRISDFRQELRTAGVDVDEERDALIVHGSPKPIPGGVTVRGHYDHAVIMAMTVLALRSGAGLAIQDPQYVAQTYPDFFNDLIQLGGTVAT